MADNEVRPSNPYEDPNAWELQPNGLVLVNKWTGSYKPAFDMATASPALGIAYGRAAFGEDVARTLYAAGGEAETGVSAAGVEFSYDTTARRKQSEAWAESETIMQERSKAADMVSAGPSGGIIENARDMEPTTVALGRMSIGESNKTTLVAIGGLLSKLPPADVLNSTGWQTAPTLKEGELTPAQASRVTLSQAAGAAAAGEPSRRLGGVVFIAAAAALLTGVL